MLHSDKDPIEIPVRWKMEKVETDGQIAIYMYVRNKQHSYKYLRHTSSVDKHSSGMK